MVTAASYQEVLFERDVTVSIVDNDIQVSEQPPKATRDCPVVKPPFLSITKAHPPRRGVGQYTANKRATIFITLSAAPSRSGSPLDA